MPSAIAPIVRAVLDVPMTRDDVFVDLGAGLGKAAMAVHLLTGARARGVELQPALATAASAQAKDLALDGVEFVRADALEADLDDATVVFLYLPFTGDVLAGVLRRLEAVARRRQIVVCALGLDSSGADWIAERPSEEFWLSIYDSRIPGAVRARVGRPHRSARSATRSRANADAVLRFFSAPSLRLPCFCLSKRWRERRKPYEP